MGAAEKTAPARHREVGSLGARTPGTSGTGQAMGGAAGHGYHRASGVRPATVDARPRTITPTAAARRALRFGAAMSRAGISVRQLAGTLGVSSSLVGAWRTPAAEKQPSERLWSLIEERAPALFAVWCRLSLAETDERPRVQLSPCGTAAAVVRASGELAAAHLEAMADGVLGDAERAHLRALVDDVEDRARRVRWALEAAE